MKLSLPRDKDFNAHIIKILTFKVCHNDFVGKCRGCEEKQQEGQLGFEFVYKSVEYGRTQYFSL